MHFGNFSWGIFAHAFYLYVIILIREFVKDLENLKGDFANNYQTVPVRFGAKTSKEYYRLCDFAFYCDNRRGYLCFFISAEA